MKKLTAATLIFSIGCTTTKSHYSPSVSDIDNRVRVSFVDKDSEPIDMVPYITPSVPTAIHASATVPTQTALSAAQDYTRLNLPEGALVRLGKESIGWGDGSVVGAGDGPLAHPQRPIRQRQIHPPIALPMRLAQANGDL